MNAILKLQDYMHSFEHTVFPQLYKEFCKESVRELFKELKTQSVALHFCWPKVAQGRH